MNLLKDFKEEREERIPCMGHANLIIPNNDDRHMVMQNEVAELRQMVLNGQNGVQRLAKPTYHKPYTAHIDDVKFPRGFKVPSFTLFNGDDLYASAFEHVGCFSTQCVSIESDP